MVLAPVVRGRKGEYGKLFEELRAEGFTRVKVDGELRRLEEDIVLDKKYKHDIAVVVDRLVMRPDLRKRLADSIETAVALAEGIVDVERCRQRARCTTYSERFTCLNCGTSMPELEPRMFSLQLAARRLPALHGARLADGDRPGADRARPVAVAERGGDPAVVHERLELLRADDAGDRRQVRGRHGHALGGPAGGRPATASSTAPTATASTSRTATATGAGAPTRRPSRASSPTSSGATARPTPTGRARRSRSTCRCGRARSARARGCGPSRWR